MSPSAIAASRKSRRCWWTKVYEGGGGVWGNDYMSANKRAGKDNIRILVRWILSLP
jgi:cytochrome c551/c552